MPLRLTYLGGAAAPLEVEGITPDSIRDKSLAEIEATVVYHGNQETPLAEFFRVQGDPGDKALWWEGNLTGVHWIGAKMTAGRMVIDGHAGRHVGSQMRGGTIHVRGDVSDWPGAEMRRGLIHVSGSAGHLVGAAYRGSRLGMRGGTILIGGGAGNEIGHTMRRGLIAIGGAIGDLAGFNMRAGTLLAFGECGIRHGAGMRRGTLGFFGERPPLLPTFRRAGRFRPLILRMLLRDLQTRGFAPAHGVADEIELHHGDLIEGGRGELWQRVEA